jgi:hypothetical protein
MRRGQKGLSGSIIQEFDGESWRGGNAHGNKQEDALGEDECHGIDRQHLERERVT